MNTAQLCHALFVAADKLDEVTMELPNIAEPQAIMLTALARAAQLTAETLKAEEAARERRAMEGVG
jgi:hypothetical protein